MSVKLDSAKLGAPEMQLQLHEPRLQELQDGQPYDRWLAPDDEVAAEFYRLDNQCFLVRFPDQVDYEIDLAARRVRGFPAPDVRREALSSLYRNSILPIIGNHTGGLNLHGSAVATQHGALAFMGISRRGKTTLAGAFAAAGYAFLTEDTLCLERRSTGADHVDYMVQPMRPVLRLFNDSASHLLGDQLALEKSDEKAELDAGNMLPFAKEPVALRHIFMLGAGDTDSITLAPVGPADGLLELIAQAFMLDVEDKHRLKAHFGRVAGLANTVACHTLDYPRRYEQLPDVIAQVTAYVAKA